ncbi:helix-turn-helix domain-containing protein [Actinacidiphila sp. bgisy160]|uniref:helix-turn-helix domain-containing protein n=1 Tax=Actinacidiphila sp. bgisy160 TaxID=3413796 RepID=UPI003D73F37A
MTTSADASHITDAELDALFATVGRLTTRINQLEATTGKTAESAAVREVLERIVPKDGTTPMVCICGKTFDATGKGRPRVYCSKSCRHKAYRNRRDAGLQEAEAEVRELRVVEDEPVTEPVVEVAAEVEPEPQEEPEDAPEAEPQAAAPRRTRAPRGPEWLTVEQAAVACDTSVTNMYRWINEGTGPKVEKVGTSNRGMRIHIRDLARWRKTRIFPKPRKRRQAQAADAA